MIKVLFAASECVPFIKTGGLADVVGSLPKYVDQEKIEIRVIVPKYIAIPEQFRNQFTYITHFYMDLGWRNQYVGILEYEYDDIHFYFIDNEYYFSGYAPYGNIYEDVEKFAFFSKACLSVLPYINFKPDVIHCNDWQTGLIPAYLSEMRKSNEFYQNIRTIMTIHNLKFQGVFNLMTMLDITGLPSYYFGYPTAKEHCDGNYLEIGIRYADYVTTVSKTYADEIKQKFFGEGLERLIQERSSRLIGIVNGIDYKEYDPSTDKLIKKNYDAITFRKYKSKNKCELQRELGLEENETIFMFGIVSRLTDQKGLDLIECVMEQICSDDIQFVILGTGDKKYEDLFRHSAYRFPNRVSANIFYNDELAHRIYAACDAYLMPSLFEPCGLSQLIALRYGTVPIVRETGGLKDTVEPYDKFRDCGTGFSFTNYNAHEMLNTLRYAKNTYYEKKREWNKIIDRGMAKDYSWITSAKEYLELYQECIANH